MTHGRPPRRELWKVHSASFGSASDRSPAGAFSSARRRRWTAWGCRAFLPRARGAAVGPGSQADTHWRPPTCISGNPRPLQPRWKLTCITASLCAMTLPRRGPGRCSSPSSPRGAPPWTTPAQEHLSLSARGLGTPRPGNPRGCGEHSTPARRHLNTPPPWLRHLVLKGAPRPKATHSQCTTASRTRDYRRECSQGPTEPTRAAGRARSPTPTGEGPEWKPSPVRLGADTGCSCSLGTVTLGCSATGWQTDLGFRSVCPGGLSPRDQQAASSVTETVRQQTRSCSTLGVPVPPGVPPARAVGYCAGLDSALVTASSDTPQTDPSAAGTHAGRACPGT